MSVRAMKAGAVDFLPKPFDNRQLLQAVRQAVERDRRERLRRAEAEAVRGRLDSLTAREREVLHLVVAGLLNKQIGHRLGVVVRTVKEHRARVMQKMQAGSVAALVRLAAQAGVLPSFPH
jgi:FixJ family two-component response regulator